jgi:hypothetical protein
VKLGALMATTGKSEIMASVFAIASNHFMQECKEDNKIEETHQEPANEPVEGPTGMADNNGPQRRKQGNQSSKMKLFDLQRVVLKNEEKELEAVARHLGPDAYMERSKGIYKALTSEEENLREKIRKEKSKEMMVPINKIKPPNARQRKKGKIYLQVFLDTSPTNPWG